MNRVMTAVATWHAWALVVVFLVGGVLSAVVMPALAGPETSATPAASATVPAVPHPVEGRANCLLCHGPSGPMSAGTSHQGRGNEICLVCHKQAPAASAPVTSAASRAPKTRHSIQGRRDCLACHDRNGPVPFGSSHNGRPNATCLACHSVGAPAAHAVVVDDSSASSSSDPGCLGCHGNKTLSMSFESGETLSLYVDTEAFRASAHGGRLSCGACHPEITAYPHPETHAQTRRDLTAHTSEACKDCHFEDYSKTLDGMHAKMHLGGRSDAPVCADCHGSHEVHDLRKQKQAISLTCSRCHSDVYDQYATSVHGKAVTEGNTDVPTCTDCHEAHANIDPRTREFRAHSHELCAKCHSDESIMKKYGITTQVLSTFFKDFHGLSISYFGADAKDAPMKATCVDCHGIHDIRAPSDPASSVWKDNLSKTCRTCHQDATDQFPSAWLGHYQPSPTNVPLVYWVKQFYKLIVPFTVGGLSLHILLDLFRIVVNRVRRGRRIHS